MAFSSCLLGVGSLPLAVGENRLPTKSPAVTAIKRALPLQVTSEGKQKFEAPKAVGVSRRDAMLCLPAGTLAAVALSPIEPAEARILNPEIKRQILEKFEKIREQFGLSKPKTNDGKESDSPPAPAPAPAPAPPNSQGNLLVPPGEAILP